MRAMLLKTEKGLRGATQTDHEAWLKFRRRLDAMKPGSWLRMEWASPRNGPQHRKFFALVELIKNNSEVYRTDEQALVAIKLAVGHFDLMTNPATGEIVQVPRSIAYENMPQDDFEAFYSAAIDGVLHYILPQIPDRETAGRLLDEIIRGWA